ncbi:hypothetical protein Y1Q_0022681 [Alligator mississippiensis]|uniref:Uncharacterized protein n=1 Tax=Alligator mississippiensis TaxID=8496 RepID=A0A151PHL5_ALLMI|nr:hypothetical protein Y1Q_0022681 [Alligator mississippiensis]
MPSGLMGLLHRRHGLLEGKGVVEGHTCTGAQGPWFITSYTIQMQLHCCFNLKEQVCYLREWYYWNTALQEQAEIIHTDKHPNVKTRVKETQKIIRIMLKVFNEGTVCKNCFSKETSELIIFSGQDKSKISEFPKEQKCGVPNHSLF